MPRGFPRMMGGSASIGEVIPRAPRRPADRPHPKSPNAPPASSATPARSHIRAAPVQDPRSLAAPWLVAPHRVAPGRSPGAGRFKWSSQRPTEGSNAPPVLEVAEQALDPIAPPVGDPAVLVGYRPGGRGRDGGDHPVALQPVPQALRIVGLVSDQTLGRHHGLHQRQRHGDVGHVAGRQGERDWSATTIGQAMDFAREPAARAADRLAPGPPFPPAAER